MRGAWLSLCKPRIVGLLTLTGLAGLGAAGGAPLGTTVGFVVAGAGTAAGAAVINCWYDRDLDRRMARTADRPLPAGEIDPRAALAFAGGLLAVAWTVGILAVPLPAMAFVWLGFLAYVGLYTVGLKRRHWLATVLGGSAGAAPVLAGWRVASPLEASAFAMAALVFVWTPAHAWALATVYRAEFAAAEVPKLPVVAGARTTARLSLGFALGTVAITAAAVLLAGRVTAAVAVVGVPALLWTYATWATRAGDARAVRAFFTANLYLALVFLGWTVDGQLGTPSTAAIGPTMVSMALLAGVTFVAIWWRRPSLGGVRSCRVPVGWVGSAGSAPTSEDDRGQPGGDLTGGP